MKISRYDITVWSVSALLIVAILLTALLAPTSSNVPRVAFLSYDNAQEVWIADVDNPENLRQATDTSIGVYDFAISPDGRKLAYSERDSNTGNTDIRLVDLVTGQGQEMTTCIDEGADCKAPVFHPDGQIVAFTRAEETISGGLGASRIWIADLTTNPISSRPLFSDSTIIGYSPIWSADGSKIAFYSGDMSNSGIIIYDVNETNTDEALQLIPSVFGTMGTLSPNGGSIVFPELVQKEDGMYAHLKLANLQDQTFTNLSDPADPIDDVNAEWSPDGKHIAVARQYLDERWTRGHQVYLITVETGEVEPLVVDPMYNTSFFSWNSDGTKLLMQRFPLLTASGDINSNGRPSIWVYDMETTELTKIYESGFLPAWVN